MQPKNSTAAPVVQLMIDERPWRLVLSLNVIAFDHSGVVALLSEADTSKGFSQEQVSSLLKENSVYKLQLDADLGFEATSSVHARLVEKRPTNSGIELGLAFRTPASTASDARRY